ncbi:hypothetical protein HBH56_148730 [Parastagonospora nodorum]|uniref:Uncharacterized protein n=1 Tax=Phaeosphaeria nodorum (strain SN15 / ATCC MYA-4574 / FGSC 10173) TaxID=321614 RepID=A0A7U2EZZ3_PHANO|nr:hypothetical protein HBH56_148730 [Parastagonospora nodorum]QRC94130.1 hypothetical protein JI435_430290 [Parastagonospora nodorum SN15]KAH3923305.1 hypothetical protein HBH54_213370 [Parastagonospora nodorum]KAH3945873.1 hypothetical protein HBH53_136180 [Parastagonospora nodorum]KAH3984001.1 hypothetical protein HBH52_063830 [Parastagonospora nodorum]
MSGKIELVLIFEKVIFHVLVYWQMLVRWNDGQQGPASIFGLRDGLLLPVSDESPSQMA